MFQDEGVFGRDEPGVFRNARIDRREGDVGKQLGDVGGGDFLDVEVLGIGRDVLQSRDQSGRIVHFDQALRFKQEDRPTAVGDIVRDDDDVAVLDFGDRRDFIRIQTHRRDDRLADRGEVVVLGRDFLVQVDHVLERIQIEFAGIQCGVGLGVVREGDDFDRDVLFGGLFLDVGPGSGFADDPDFDDDGFFLGGTGAKR